MTQPLNEPRKATLLQMAELFLKAHLPNGLLRAGQKGEANGFASLDATGKVPVAQLPSGTGGSDDFAFFLSSE